MSRRLSALLVAALFLPAVPAHAESASPMHYPETRRDSLVETLFGEKIADPYRWLENDVRQDKEVADWVARENEVTQGYLATLPERGWFAERLRSLLNYERFGLPGPGTIWSTLVDPRPVGLGAPRTFGPSGANVGEARLDPLTPSDLRAGSVDRGY